MDHECPELRAEKKKRNPVRDLQPDLVSIGRGVGEMTGWYLSIEEYAFEIKFCPFCGSELAH